MSHFPDHLEEVEVLEDHVSTDNSRDLMVFNDDVNTFEHVIETLIEVCDHSPQQAEQCTWIIHYNGKCSVKIGSFDQLKPMRQKICDHGITAEIV